MASFQELETCVERSEREVAMLKMRLKTTLPSEPPIPDELSRRRQVAAKILAFAESKQGRGSIAQSGRSHQALMKTFGNEIQQEVQ